MKYGKRALAGPALTLALMGAFLASGCGGGGGGGGGTQGQDTTKPTITITSHTDAQVVTGSNTVTLQWSASDDVEVTSATLTLNGADQSVSGTPAGYSADLTLSDGSNTVVITAKDKAENEATASLTLDYLGQPKVALTFGIKQLQFHWEAVTGATHYRLFEKPDSASDFAQVGGDISGTGAALDISVHRHDWAGARYRVEACNNEGCTGSDEVDTVGRSAEPIGYFKASNSVAYDWFGEYVALSGDGNTLAVAAVGEGGGATGINGDQSIRDSSEAGAIYLFARTGGTWVQQAYIKASNTEVWDRFSYSPSLSDDGNTLAVGAPGEDSGVAAVCAPGPACDDAQADNSKQKSGAVYVFVRNGETWSQQAYLKAFNLDAADEFGQVVALSNDGNTLAVGAPNEQSATAGICDSLLSCTTNNSANEAGAVYVFERNDGTWSAQAYLKASNPDIGDNFGSAVALKGEGDTLTLAVGATHESSAAQGVCAPGSAGCAEAQADNLAPSAGAVYLFARAGGSWQQQAYVKASNAGKDDLFGRSVSLSSDGNSLAAGAYGEASAATGVCAPGAACDLAQQDDSDLGAGAAYLFTRSGETWQQQAYVKASNTGAGDRFGEAVSLSGDGKSLLVGARSEDSDARGLNGDQSDAILSTGAAYLYVRTGESWLQQSYVKASNTKHAYDVFGASVALNSDGSTLAIGAPQESSNAAGINGDQDDTSGADSGAAYLY